MGFEFKILDWIQSIRTPFGDWFMPFVSKLGNVGMIWILLAAVLIILPKTRKSGIILAAALCLDVIICNVLLKNIFCRIRPCDVNTAVTLLIPRPHDFSFPSGHTAASFAAVSALYFAREKWLWKPVLGLAALIAFSRLYLYVHYPTDILGGIFIGLAAGYVGYRLVRKTALMRSKDRRQEYVENIGNEKEDNRAAD